MKHSLKKILGTRCPTCGAKAGEKCELTTGQPRVSPHRNRRLAAEDTEGLIEQSTGSEISVA